MRGKEAKTAFWTSVGLATTIGTIALMGTSGGEVTESEKARELSPLEPSKPLIVSSPFPSEILDDAPACPPDFEGRGLKPGEWPLKIIREYGIPGTEDSPIIYIDRGGNTHRLNNWREFKGYQYPGEKICVPKPNENSSLLDPRVVYEATKHQNSTFAQRSVDIQAAIRSKQGF